MNRKQAAMATIAKDTFRADELPGPLTAQVGGTEAADMFVVEARRLSADEVAKLSQFHAKLQAGIDELEAGRGIDGEQVLARLRARHFPVS